MRKHNLRTNLVLFIFFHLKELVKVLFLKYIIHLVFMKIVLANLKTVGFQRWYSTTKYQTYKKKLILKI
jgi:hypothetical protein